MKTELRRKQSSYPNIISTSDGMYNLMGQNLGRRGSRGGWGRRSSEVAPVSFDHHALNSSRDNFPSPSVSMKDATANASDVTCVVKQSMSRRRLGLPQTLLAFFKKLRSINMLMCAVDGYARAEVGGAGREGESKYGAISS